MRHFTVNERPFIASINRKSTYPLYGELLENVTVVENRPCADEISSSN